MQNISARTEAVLKQVIIGSMDYLAVGKSTRPGGLKGNEICGALANLPRAQFLSLAIWGGFSKESDAAELLLIVFDDYIIKQSWFDSVAYIRQEDQRRKIGKLAMTAIESQRCAKGMTEPMIAERMGITKQAFNKTWKPRYEKIQQLLSNWCTQGAQKVHDNASNR